MARAKIFSIIDRIEKKYNEARFDSKPRHLQAVDYDDWSHAADASPLNLQTRAQVADALRRINPVRWRQCQNDYRWMQKQMKKLGLNPEDARYIFP